MGNSILHEGSTLLLASLAALLTATGAACSGTSAPTKTLQSVAVGAGTGKAFAAVGIPQQLTAVGKYSDGTSAALTTGVTWASSDETIASVDESGRLSPWRRGDGVVITVTHKESGISATAALSCRDVIRVAVGQSVVDAIVDRTETYFRVSGLQPATLYRVNVNGMTDDVDLFVYGDTSMSAGSELCVSDKVSTYDESCTAAAGAAGELWIKVNGQWTNAGAKFSLGVQLAQPVALAGTLAFPAQFPREASIGRLTEVYNVTGLTAGGNYEVRVSHLTANIDVQVFGDVFEHAFLCASYKSATEDDACTATATAQGELFVAISGETTTGGGSYALNVSSK